MTDTQSLPEDRALPPSQLPQLIYWAYGIWYHMVWNIPLASLGQLSQLRPLPASCAPCRPGQCEKLKNPSLPSNTKNMSILSTLFSSQIQNTALHQLPERKLTLSYPKPGQWAGHFIIIYLFAVQHCSFSTDFWKKDEKLICFQNLWQKKKLLNKQTNKKWRKKAYLCPTEKAREIGGRWEMRIIEG